jgi:hypothetical protein
MAILSSSSSSSSGNQLRVVEAIFPLEGSGNAQYKDDDRSIEYPFQMLSLSLSLSRFCLYVLCSEGNQHAHARQ